MIKTYRLRGALISGAISGADLDALLVTREGKATFDDLINDIVWVRHIAWSATATEAVFTSPVATEAVFTSPVATEAVFASPIAMRAVAATPIAIEVALTLPTTFEKLMISPMAMKEIVASAVALNVVWASSVAMEALATSDVAKAALRAKATQYGLSYNDTAVALTGRSISVETWSSSNPTGANDIWVTLAGGSLGTGNSTNGTAMSTAVKSTPTTMIKAWSDFRRYISNGGYNSYVYLVPVPSI